MQAALLQNSISSTRADLFAKSGAGSDQSSFRTALDQAVDRGESTKGSPRASGLGAERDIRPTAKVENGSEPDPAVDAERLDGSESNHVDAAAKPEDAQDSSADGQEKAAVSAEKITKKPKAEGVEKQHDSDAQAAAAAASGAIEVQQQPVPSDAPASHQQVDGTVAGDATEATDVALTQTVQAATAQGTSQAADAIPSVPANAAKSSGQGGGNKKLDGLVAGLDPTTAALDESNAVTSPNGKSGAEGESNNAGDLAADQQALTTPGKEVSHDKAAPASFDRELNSLQTADVKAAHPDTTQAAKVVNAIPLTPEQKFIQDNVDQVVTSVRTQSVTGGGQMNVRLDPPELGALQVAVKMIEGRLTASFITSNEQATQLLSHSLQHLKSSLEASGVNVDRIEVRQASPSESSQSKSSGDSQQQQQRGFDTPSQQSEQHRKEMVRKMWRKLAFGTDELDLVA